MHTRIFFIFVVLLFANPQLIRGQNENISRSSDFDGEPYIACNPQNTNNIVIAWMGYTYGKNISIKTECSFDGGKTWGNENTLPHLSTGFTSADVSMAYHNGGIVYITYIDYSESPAKGGIYITHSTDGGKLWSNPVKVWDVLETTKEAIDRPWLVVDNTGGKNDGTLYITTKPAPWIPAPNRPYLKYSSDSGKTWSDWQYLDSTGYLVGNTIQAPMAAPSVTADGAFMAIYPSYLSSQSPYPQAFYTKTYDKGKTFTRGVVASKLTGTTDTIYKLGQRFFADPKNKDNVTSAWVDSRNGDPDVYSSSSSDSGKTWGREIRVNDDSVSNGVAQDLVWGVYDTSGNIVLTWRDRRNASGTGDMQPYDIYASVSKNNGNTFSKNIRITDTTNPFNSILEKKGNDFMSSYLLNDTIYSSWGDVRTGYLNIFFARTAITGTTTNIVIAKEKTQSMTVYPSPAKNQINISYTSEENMQVVIYVTDLQGKNILKPVSHRMLAGNQVISLGISILAAGNYICTVKCEEGNQSARFEVE